MMLACIVRAFSVGESERYILCNALCLLVQANLQVNDLFVDLQDGKMLMKLLEIISGENLGKPNKGVLRVMKVENVNKSLAFLSTKVSKHKVIHHVHVLEVCPFIKEGV